MKKILLSFICLLAATGAFALAQINVSFHNIQIINAGASATVEVWAAAGPGYVSQDGSTTNPDGSWVTLQVRFDMNIPGTTTLQSGSVARNTSVTTGGSFQNNILPFGSSTTNADGGITFNNSNNSAGDLTATPIRLGTVTLNFTGGTVTAANILTPRQSDNSTLPNPTSFWTTNGAPAAQNPIGLVALTPLPVKLLSFDAAMDRNCVVHLDWKTTNELGVSKFVAAYSSDGITFNDIGEQSSKNNVSGSDYSLSWNSAPNGKGFYRLRVIEENGKYYYSNMLKLDNDCNRGHITMSPNPAHDKIAISGLSGNNNIMIVDAAGRACMKIHASGSQALVDISSLATGIYTVNIVGEGAASTSIELVKE